MGGSPAAAAHRLIIARTTRRSSARPFSRRPARSTALEEHRLGLLEPGHIDLLVESGAARWWAGTSCRFPPFSWSLSHAPVTKPASGDAVNALDASTAARICTPNPTVETTSGSTSGARRVGSHSSASTAARSSVTWAARIGVDPAAGDASIQRGAARPTAA